MSLLQYLEMEGKRFVVIEENDFRNLVKDPTDSLPPMPQPLSSGNYPAVEASRALLARRIVAARQRAGWGQAELARRAGIRAEVLNRLEKLKTSPDESTVKKIARALKKIGVEV